jgi:hypothetical protein
MNAMRDIIVMITTPAKSKFHCESNWLVKLNNVNGAVTFFAPGTKRSDKIVKEGSSWRVLAAIRGIKLRVQVFPSPKASR